MIYITGDCHRNFERFNRSIFPEQQEMTKEDYVIVCGDFGGVWNKGKENKEETQEPDMPMESKKNIGKLVNEIVNSVLSDFDDDESDREDNIIRNKKVSDANPFKSKY